MSKSDSQKKDSVKAKSVTSPAELLKNLNLMFDQLQALEASGKGDPHVEKYIRVFVDTSYHGFKKAVEKIRAQNPAIKETPADSNDPREYFRNVHRWCVGQLYWENGERIGAAPAGAGQENKGTKRKCERFKNFCLIIYEKTMKSFFDSIMGR